MSGNSKQRRQFRRRLAREGRAVGWPRTLPPYIAPFDVLGPSIWSRLAMAQAQRTDLGSLDHLINSWYGSPVAPFDVRSMVAAMDGDEPEDEEDTTT